MTATPEELQNQPELEPVVPDPLIYTFDDDRAYDPLVELPTLLSRAKEFAIAIPGTLEMRLQNKYTGASSANRLDAYLDSIAKGSPGILIGTSQYGNSVEIVDTVRPGEFDPLFELKNYKGTLRILTFHSQAVQAEIMPRGRFVMPETMIQNVNGIAIGMNNRSDEAKYRPDGTISELTWQTYCDSTSSYRARTTLDIETGILRTTYSRAYDQTQDLPPGDGFIRYYWDNNSTRMMRCRSTGIVQPQGGNPALLRCEFESFDLVASHDLYVDTIQAPVLFPSHIFPTRDFEEYQTWIQANWKAQFPILQQRQTVINHQFERVLQSGS